VNNKSLGDRQSETAQTTKQNISPDSNNPILNAALGYARRGWHVFPATWPLNNGKCSCSSYKKKECGAIGKHPIEKGWQKKASSDPEVVKAMWNRNPQANIAIATGRRSGFFALDVDLKEDGPERLKELEEEHGLLPDTIEAITGSGGRHIFFKYPECVTIKNEVRFDRGLDIRSDGGLIIAAPSLHASGGQYKWNTEFNPDDYKLAECPQWLLKLIIGSVSSKGDLERVYQGEKFHVNEIIPEGYRDNTLFKLGCSLRRKGLSPESIIQVLYTENEVRCIPPLPKEQVDAKIQSVLSYEPGCLEIVKDAKQRVPKIPLDDLFVSFHVNEKIAPVPWIIEKVIAEGDVTFIIGPPKGGKTWLGLRMACEVSNGGELLGGLAEVVQQKVLYLVYDNVGRDGIMRRIKKARLNPDPNYLSFIFREDLMKKDSDINMDLDKPDSVFEQLIDQSEARLVIIDTLGSAHEQNENKNEEMKIIMNKLIKIARGKKIGIFVLHHSRKKKIAEYGVALQQDDAIGASIFQRQCSGIIGVSKTSKPSEAGTGEKIIHRVKVISSWHREWEPFEFTIVDKQDLEGYFLAMTIDHSISDNIPALPKILEVIKDLYWAQDPFTKQDIMTKTGLGSTTVSKILNKLTEEGKLEAHGTTKDKTFQLKAVDQNTSRNTDKICKVTKRKEGTDVF